MASSSVRSGALNALHGPVSGAGYIGTRPGSFAGADIPTNKNIGPSVSNVMQFWNMEKAQRQQPAVRPPFDPKAKMDVGANALAYPMSLLPYTPDLDDSISDRYNFIDQSGMLPNLDSRVQYTLPITDTMVGEWKEKLKAQEFQTFQLWARSLFNMNDPYQRAQFWNLFPEQLEANYNWIDNQVELQKAWAKILCLGVPNDQKQLFFMWALNTGLIDLYPGSVADPSQFSKPETKNQFITNEALGIFNPMRMASVVYNPESHTNLQPNKTLNMMQKWYGAVPEPENKNFISEGPDGMGMATSFMKGPTNNLFGYGTGRGPTLPYKGLGEKTWWTKFFTGE